MTDLDKLTLLGLNKEAAVALIERLGERRYRANQLQEGVYRQRAASIEEISTLPQELMAKLAKQGVSVGLPRIEQRFVSQDGTIRYLMGFSDGESVETVWMPEGDGGEAGDGTDAYEEPAIIRTHRHEWHRATICVSSQVGCAVNCQFCLTAKLGVKRNLSSGE